MTKKHNKTENITIRVTQELKEQLQEIADGKKRTLSQTVALILEAYCEDSSKAIEI